MHPFEYSISLRVHGDFDVDGLTRLLRIQPATCRRAGDISGFFCKTGEPVFAKKSFISLHLVQNAKGDFVDSIKKICAFLEKKGKRYLKVAKENDIDLFIGLFGNKNFGFVLDRKTLKRAERLGLDLSFDIYPDEKIIRKGRGKSKGRFD